VPPRRINKIVLSKRAITADTDLRLARDLGISEGFFIGLQTDYELMERKRRHRRQAQGDPAAGGVTKHTIVTLFVCGRARARIREAESARPARDNEKSKRGVGNAGASQKT
jgi:hypothetical protein